MIFRQLFDTKSSTYTYLLGCEETREAVLIDPVDTQIERDLKLLKELNLNLIYDIETHIHADHVTAGHALRKHISSVKTIVGINSGAKFDEAVFVKDGDHIKFGKQALLVLETPGHTSGCTSYIYQDEMVFTGDALFIRGCGRTDFQQGDPKKLFESVQKIYKLPGTCKVYPAHDYKGMMHSTIDEEKNFNPRLHKDQTEEGFVKIMSELKLQKPGLIDVAVPANLLGGETVESK